MNRTVENNLVKKVQIQNIDQMACSLSPISKTMYYKNSFFTTSFIE